MAIKDLREYIERLDKYGELQRIDSEVDWNLEAGAITRRAIELGAPAPWMRRIKGYPEGYSLLGALVSGSKVKGTKPWRRLAIAFEMDPDSSYSELLDEMLRRQQHPLKPVVISDGPCKQNVVMGKDVNLFNFPIPMIHDGDGGRYLSFHVCVAKDPDSDWVNWGMYRIMIQTRTKFGGHLLPQQHMGMIYYGKHEPRGQAMPVNIVLGTEPLLTEVGGLPLPMGINEADIAGGLRREPVELIQAETNNLYVPANAEIVFECEMRPHERMDEGPFGEHHGYMQGPRLPAPVYRVNCITFRNNPIIPFCCAGTPSDESTTSHTLCWMVAALQILRHEKGFDIRDVYCPPEGSADALIVSAKIPYPHFAKQIADSIWGSKFGFLLQRIIVVDEDVDACDMEQVLHAIATRCHPQRGIFTHPYAPGHPVMPASNLHERQYGQSQHLLLDCTLPTNWDLDERPRQGSFQASFPQEIKDKVLSNWTQVYGYEKEDYRVR